MPCCTFIYTGKYALLYIHLHWQLCVTVHSFTLAIMHYCTFIYVGKYALTKYTITFNFICVITVKCHQPPLPQHMMLCVSSHLTFQHLLVNQTLPILDRTLTFINGVVIWSRTRSIHFTFFIPYSDVRMLEGLFD